MTPSIPIKYVRVPLEHNRGKTATTFDPSASITPRTTHHHGGTGGGFIRSSVRLHSPLLATLAVLHSEHSRERRKAHHASLLTGLQGPGRGAITSTVLPPRGEVRF